LGDLAAIFTGLNERRMGFESLTEKIDANSIAGRRLWYSLVDYATVYDESDVRFTFKNGAEIQA
jgi:hypothetical protein